MKKTGKKAALAAGVAATLAAPLTAHFEGLRLRSYLDPVGIPTICYGETEGVELGQVLSKPECDKMLTARLGWFSAEVYAASARDIPPETHAALTSFAYNVGIGAFNKSTLLRRLNAGDTAGACDELMRWVFAGGKKLTGLVKRRGAERELCLKGISFYENEQ